MSNNSTLDSKRKASLSVKVMVMMTFVFWMSYENVAFFYPDEYGGVLLVAFALFMKLMFPFILAVYVGIPQVIKFIKGRASLYVSLFGLLILWSFIPTLVGGDVAESFKLIPRYVFFIAVGSLFLRHEHAFSLFAKCVVCYVVFALVQYILIYALGQFENVISYSNQRMAGPYGILGNVTSMMIFPGAPFPFVRLTGFWNEPSNASGSSFLSFFLARFLYRTGHGFQWNLMSYASLIAGFLALSNAGYLSIAVATTFYIFFHSKKGGGNSLVSKIVLLVVVGVFAGVVLLGRSYVSENLQDNFWARAITGVRQIDDDYDTSGGRREIFENTANQIYDNVFGAGLQDASSDRVVASGSAPIFWLQYLGIPGFILLMFRESALLWSIRSAIKRNPESMLLCQGLVVVLTQHCVYGSWMNPNYFCMAAIILVYANSVKKQLSKTALFSAPDEPSQVVY